MSRYIRQPVVDFISKRDKGKCVYCGFKPRKLTRWIRKVLGKEYRPLELGHVIPFAKGGNNCIDNIQLECFTHNRGKGSTEVRLSFWKRWTRKEAQGCKGRCNHLK